jgi:tetratricopeptide (TPR) repeat protein
MLNSGIPVYLFVSIVFLYAPGKLARAAEALLTEGGKTACCQEVDTTIARLHKNAERLYAQFKPRDAANELQKILQQDGQNFEALAKLARAHIDIGDMISGSSQDAQDRKMKEYRTAEDYARQAIKINPNSTWGHFYVAASLGSMAMLSPVAKQIDMAGEIRNSIEKAIALDSQNGFAYHVYGVWHRKMAEIGKASRMVVSVLYGRSIPAGTLEKSIEYLRKAVTLNPTVIVSRLELARSFAAVEEWSLARQSLAAIRELPIKFSDDAKHKEKAEQLLDEIKER